MDSAAAALLGMGLAAAGFAGAGVGIGYIFGKMIEAVAASRKQKPASESICGSGSRWWKPSRCTAWSLPSSSWGSASELAKF